MPEQPSTDKKAEQAQSDSAANESGVEMMTTGKVNDFPVIGLGASAGGLEALSSFFSNVSANSGMAYIVLVHMSPDQPSMMPELLQKKTRIPVSAATDGQTIEPDHAYVIPPNKEISIFQGQIQLLDLVKKKQPMPIDLFLRSLATDQGRLAAAVILSGTGTDGTLGIKEIKALDGLVVVQSEQSAAHDGMPRSARETGLADMILPPTEMPKKLEQYYAHAEVVRNLKSRRGPDPTHEQRDWLKKIFAVLRSQKGHDFSSYKANTILRRISRRMGINHIESHETYVRFLRENPAEAETLFRELLIGVTSFFRDPASFDILKEKVLPALLKQTTADETFRVWIPGCSTGEEVYSMAIVIQEALAEMGKKINLQLFGTDIDNYAIDRARAGVFPASIATEVSPERLKRFFIQEGDAYRIKKELRDLVIFSVQDITKDPPFSRLNLLCCRNLLIYLENEAQKKLLPLFHYTLKPGGVLVLGSSETIGGFTRMFAPIDKKWKIFRRQEVPREMRQQIQFPSGSSSAADSHEPAEGAAASQRPDIGEITKNLIIDQFAPTAVMVDAQGNMLYVQGRSGKYLETTTGNPTQNILNLAREGLRVELSSALREARASNHKVTRQRVSVKTNGDFQIIDLHVFPQSGQLTGRFLVVFEDVDVQIADSTADGYKKLPLDDSRIADLEKELQITREGHQTAIEQLESTNEALKSTNEELQSANEELQSTNEELESSKEELQSLNEELQTVNSELESKLDELSAAENDMHNLLNSTEVATIFVDNDLRIRRFTPEATKIVNLIQSDIGRPLRHTVTNLAYGDMMTDLDAVLEKLASKEEEVQTTDGHWYKMRIMPYRTVDNRIDGAVLVFSSIDIQKQTQEALKASVREKEASLELVRAVFDMNVVPLAVLDKDGRMVIANLALSEIFGLAQDDIEGKDIFELDGPWQEQANLKTELKKALDQGVSFKSRPFEANAAESREKFMIHGRIIKKDENFPYRILLQFIKQNSMGMK